MISIGTNLFKFDVVSLCDSPRNREDGERDIVVQERFSVFDGKDDVIVGIICVVGSSEEDHALILFGNRGFPNLPPRYPRQAAGKYPAGIIYPMSLP